MTRRVFHNELVTQLPIDALDEGVLDRFARRDIVPCHLVPISPLLDRIDGERAAVVADNHLS